MLTDMAMPGRPQGPVLGERARILRPGIWVMFMTGYPIAASDGGVGIGPGDVLLSKPISKGDLARSIWKQLNGDATE